MRPKIGLQRGKLEEYPRVIVPEEFFCEETPSRVRRVRRLRNREYWNATRLGKAENWPENDADVTRDDLFRFYLDLRSSFLMVVDATPPGKEGNAAYNWVTAGESLHSWPKAPSGSEPVSDLRP